MKIYLSILTCLLLACANPKEKTPKNILPKTTFKSILKEIHLTEARFELNKHNSNQNFKNELANAYLNIYKTHQTSEKKFKASINYYSERPEELQKIYTNILDVLNEEKPKFDQ